MELCKDEKTKKVFMEDENKMYTMFDMGSYVGHKNRPWYAQKPEVWRLMFYDKKLSDGRVIHIEALVDDKGNYTRILVEMDKVRRAIQIINGMVFNDSIVKFSSDDLYNEGFTFLDGDIYSEHKIALEKYLSTSKEFELDGEPYAGEVVNDALIIEFLEKNKELIEIIAEEKRRRRH